MPLCANSRSPSLTSLIASTAFMIKFRITCCIYGDLQERESKVRRLVDANIIGICIFNLDRRIMEANDAFLSIVVYSRDDVISGRQLIGSRTILIGSSSRNAAPYGQHQPDQQS